MKPTAHLLLGLMLLGSSLAFAQSSRPPQYDLTCSAFTYSPSKPVVGDALRFEYTIANFGKDAVPPNSYDIDLYLDDKLIAFDHGTKGMKGRPGRTVYAVPATEDSKLITPGVHRYKLVIDSKNRLPESNERNNVREGTITVH